MKEGDIVKLSNEKVVFGIIKVMFFIFVVLIWSNIYANI